MVTFPLSLSLPLTHRSLLDSLRDHRLKAIVPKTTTGHKYLPHRQLIPKLKREKQDRRYLGKIGNGMVEWCPLLMQWEEGKKERNERSESFDTNYEKNSLRGREKNEKRRKKEGKGKRIENVSRLFWIHTHRMFLFLSIELHETARKNCKKDYFSSFLNSKLSQLSSLIGIPSLPPTTSLSWYTSTWPAFLLHCFLPWWCCVGNNNRTYCGFMCVLILQPKLWLEEKKNFFMKNEERTKDGNSTMPFEGEVKRQKRAEWLFSVSHWVSLSPVSLSSLHFFLEFYSFLCSSSSFLVQWAVFLNSKRVILTDPGSSFRKEEQRRKECEGKREDVSQGAIKGRGRKSRTVQLGNPSPSLLFLSSLSFFYFHFSLTSLSLSNQNGNPRRGSGDDLITEVPRCDISWLVAENGLQEKFFPPGKSVERIWEKIHIE